MALKNTNTNMNWGAADTYENNVSSGSVLQGIRPHAECVGLCLGKSHGQGSDAIEDPWNGPAGISPV